MSTPLASASKSPESFAAPIARSKLSSTGRSWLISSMRGVFRQLFLLALRAAAEVVKIGLGAKQPLPVLLDLALELRDAGIPSGSASGAASASCSAVSSPAADASASPSRDSAAFASAFSVSAGASAAGLSRSLSALAASPPSAAASCSNRCSAAAFFACVIAAVHLLMLRSIHYA